MTAARGPRLAASVRGFPAFAIATFVDRRGLMDALGADVHPSYRAELQSVIEDLRLAGEQWRDYRASVSDVGTAEVPDAVSPAGSLMTTTEAAEVLGVTDRRVRQQLERGELLGSKSGGRWMVDAAAVALRVAS